MMLLLIQVNLIDNLIDSPMDEINPIWYFISNYTASLMINSSIESLTVKIYLITDNI